MKIGLVGCGLVSQHHLKAAVGYPGNEVVGIADRSLPLARAQAERFKVPRVFSTLSELLELRPDVVHVLTPPDTHEALVLQCLAAGAHVYVEKPMAVSVAACENMQRAAAQASRELCVGQSLLYTPAMDRARELIASGKAGDIIQVAASFNYDVRRNPSYRQGHWAATLPGGLAEDLAVHPASILISLLGAPKRVSAVSRSDDSVPDGKTADVNAAVECERGIGSLAVSLRARPDMGLVDICCTRMMLRLNISSMAVIAYRELKGPKPVARALSNLDAGCQLFGGTFGSAWKLLRGKIDGSYGIVPLIHKFYAAIQAGKPAPVASAHGALVVSIMRSIWPEVEDTPRVEAPRDSRHAKLSLVTGATGFIGQHLVRALLDRGDDVRVLARKESRARFMRDTRAQIVIGDLEQPEALRGLTRDVDAVFHLASAMKGSDIDFERIDLRGTEWLLQEATRERVRRFIYAGTLSAYPLADGPPGAVIDERSALDETGRLGNYARFKVRAEQAVLHAQRAGALEGVIVRLGLTCGIGSAVLPAHVCRVVGGKLMVVFGKGDLPLPLTLVDNAVDALLLAATVPNISGESFNIVDNEVLTQQQYLDLYRQATGTDPRVINAPRAMYYLLGAVSELSAVLRGKEAATTRWRVRNRLCSVRWDCSKAQQMLRWQARVPLRAGLTEMFRAHAAAL